MASKEEKKTNSKKKKEEKDVVKTIEEQLESIDQIEKNLKGNIEIEAKFEKVEEKPEYVEEMMNDKKKKIYIAINILVLIIILLVFSTIFALLNLGKTTFAKGTKIKNVDISNLTTEEAKNKINESLNIELLVDIDLKYNEYESNFETNQIEYKYNIDKAISEAFNIGKSENIIKNNYEILLTAFFGKNIEPEYSYNEELLNYIVDDVASKIPNIVVQPTYYIEETQLIINRGTDGIDIKKDKLKEKILDNIKNRNAEAIIFDNSNQVIEIPVAQVKADDIDIEKIYTEIHTEPKDAYYVENPFKIFVEINGIDLDMPLEEAKILISAEAKDEYILPLKVTPPEKTINDIGKEAFPYMISSFSTKYDASNKNRSKNLEIAAEKINGTVIMPGDVFSYNKVVGKRTVEEGYTNAKLYENGQVVDGLAGGICQISSTLYNAVLLANLEIVERRNHSFKTSYLPAGRDATVVYGVTDFQFKNSRTYPIKIETIIGNGIVEFRVHGINEEVEYEVKIIPITTQSIPYTTQFIQDSKLQPGTQVTEQKGSPGYKTTTYKELRLNGTVISREAISNDSYSPLKAIIRVGPANPEPPDSEE